MKHKVKFANKLQERLSRGKSTIGIDIGTSSVNISQVAKYKGKLTLIKTETVDIDIRNNADRDQATLKVLTEAFFKFNSTKAKIVCVVSCPKTFVRKVVTPYMPKEELENAVSLDIKRSIPFSLNQAVLDFNVIEEVKMQGAAKLGINVAISPKETIDRMLSFFIKSKPKPFSGSISKKFKSEDDLDPLGIKVSALLPLSLVLENIIEKSKRKTEETLVTMEMGTDITELNIYKNSRLEFSRKIPFSGKDITKSLTQALITDKGRIELTIDEAEKIKREVGMPKIEENRLVDEKITTNQILSLIRPKVEHLINEVERSFDFYREEMRGKKIDRIILFGGGANLRGLPEFINKELDIEVSIGNPLEDIDLLYDGVVKSEEDAQRLVLSIGAALSSMKGINLLPKEMKGKVGRSVKNIIFNSVVAVLVFLLSGALFVLSGKKVLYKNQYDQIKQKYKGLTSGLKQLYQDQLVLRVKNDQHDWGEILKDVSNVTPNNMFLDKFAMGKEKITIKGSINQEARDGETTLSDFMLGLEEGMFKNVRLVSTNKIEDEFTSILNFEINCFVD
ncbi:MAG: pilus assembly protein PilM [Candidatus Zapsychrus exili]|nr:pilus assembly protein PilM [Candidatus Zapsychrus exili]